MLGRSLNYDAKAAGIFLFPADTGNNNQRVYVLNAAVNEVKQVA